MMQRRTLDATAPILILAPHLIYPARNGSDISLDRIGRCLSMHVPHVDLIAERLIVRFEHGREMDRRPFANVMRSKNGAGARTLLRRSHFYLEKFLTPAYAKTATRYLRDPAYKTVLCSYATTTHLITQTRDLPDGRLHLIWSHNDEFKWFADLHRQSTNPLARFVAKSSERWLHAFFQKNRDTFLFLHVTKADRDGFARYYPDHASLIIPIGVDLPETPSPPLLSPIEPVCLMFVGALGVRMNLDALTHFSETYFPSIHSHFGDDVQVMVVGSGPSEAVQTLCTDRGWDLHADVSDSELDRLFGQAAFSILPFGYATGAKLKLLNSLAHGVPFLATTKVGAQADACAAPCLLDDNPEAWVDRITRVRNRGLSAEDRAGLVAIAKSQSWEASAAKLIEGLTA